MKVGEDGGAGNGGGGKSSSEFSFLSRFHSRSFFEEWMDREEESVS